MNKTYAAFAAMVFFCCAASFGSKPKRPPRGLHKHKRRNVRKPQYGQHKEFRSLEREGQELARMAPSTPPQSRKFCCVARKKAEQTDTTQPTNTTDRYTLAFLHEMSQRIANT